MNPTQILRDDDPLLLDRQVCFPLYAASNLLTRVYRPVLAPLGLTYSQYLVMLVLWEQSPASVGELGERLHLDSGTLTPLLKRMEQGRFIDRGRDPDDERRVLVSLTKHGLRLHTAALTVPDTLAHHLNLDPAVIEELRNSVRTSVHILAGHTNEQPSLESPKFNTVTASETAVPRISRYQDIAAIVNGSGIASCADPSFAPRANL
jgi:DNA-binding MarR family transcriptional regulator